MSEQTVKQFLFSKEGRGVLIGSAAAIAFFAGIGYYSYSALFPSNEPPQREVTQETRDAAGNTAIRTPNSNVAPDRTSQDLTPQGRQALSEFNLQQEAEGRMTAPTPDDVETVDVSTPETEQPTTERERNTTQNRAVQREEDRMRAQQQRDRLAAEEERLQIRSAIAQDYRQRRFAAANEIIGLYSEPAGMAGMAMAGSGTNSGLSAPAVVSVDNNGRSAFRESDGTGSTGRSRSGQCESPLLKGGEIRYAQTDIALNTDFEGPIRMTFLDGNIAGFVGLGSFELNELGAKMKLRIDRLFDPDGQSYSVSGYVLDPETTLWAMASDVDYHIIYRYGGFGLGTILSAFGTLAENRAQQSQIVTPDGTVATTNRDPDSKQVTWTLLGEFSRLFEESFRDNINRPITVTLDPNEEAGVLFEDTVCELDNEITRERREAERRQASGLADPLSQVRR